MISWVGVSEQMAKYEIVSQIYLSDWDANSAPPALKAGVVPVSYTAIPVECYLPT